MAFRSPGQSRPAGSRPVVMPRWPRYLIPAVLIIIAAIVIISVVAGVWTDFLWFRSVGYTRIFSTTYGTKWALFIVAALFMATAIVLVGCYYGYNASGGPVGVGTATAKSMVLNIILVHLIGMLGTQIFWGANPKAPIGG